MSGITPFLSKQYCCADEHLVYFLRAGVLQQVNDVLDFRFFLFVFHNTPPSGPLSPRRGFLFHLLTLCSVTGSLLGKTQFMEIIETLFVFLFVHTPLTPIRYIWITSFHTAPISLKNHQALFTPAASSLPNASRILVLFSSVFIGHPPLF